VGWGLSSADKGGGGSSDAGVRTFWRKKYRFFLIYGVSARTGELSQCGQGGQFFAILCGHLLWTALMTRGPILRVGEVISNNLKILEEKKRLKMAILLRLL